MDNQIIELMEDGNFCIVSNKGGRRFVVKTEQDFPEIECYLENLSRIADKIPASVNVLTISDSVIASCAYDYESSTYSLEAYHLLFRHRHFLEGIICHEIAHINHRDINILSKMFIVRRLWQLSIISLAILPVSKVLLPYLLGMLLIHIWGERYCRRMMEYRADTAAMSMSRNPLDIAFGLELLSDLEEVHGGISRAWNKIRRLTGLATHPLIRERVTRLMRCLNLTEADMEAVIYRCPECNQQTGVMAVMVACIGEDNPLVCYGERPSVHTRKIMQREVSIKPGT